MKNQSRRRFINSMVGSGVGLGALPLMSFVPKVKAAKNASDKLPVINEVDICVLGGSCTGVFAAVRASRLGARVAIIEKQNSFGGMATNAFVNIWHSLFNTEFNKQIIAGLTLEVMDRLSVRDAVVNTSNNPSRAFTFNSQELKIELDELVMESGINPICIPFFRNRTSTKTGNWQVLLSIINPVGVLSKPGILSMPQVMVTYVNVWVWRHTPLICSNLPQHALIMKGGTVKSSRPYLGNIIKSLEFLKDLSGGPRCHPLK
jgi:hypothetical protein